MLLSLPRPLGASVGIVLSHPPGNSPWVNLVNQLHLLDCALHGLRNSLRMLFKPLLTALVAATCLFCLHTPPMPAGLQCRTLPWLQTSTVHKLPLRPTWLLMPLP